MPAARNRWFKRAELIGAATEAVGYKAGLTLTREAAAGLVGLDFSGLWTGADDATMRVRGEEFEALIAELLYKVGAIASASLMPPTIKLFHKFKNDPDLAPISIAVSEKVTPTLKGML